jgi:hypothetical protein
VNQKCTDALKIITENNRDIVGARIYDSLPPKLDPVTKYPSHRSIHSQRESIWRLDPGRLVIEKVGTVEVFTLPACRDHRRPLYRRRRAHPKGRTRRRESPRGPALPRRNGRTEALGRVRPGARLPAERYLMCGQTAKKNRNRERRNMHACHTHANRGIACCA